jgi:hypothetical protein
MAKTQTIEITITGNNVTAIKAIDGTETKIKGLGNTANSTSSLFGNMFGSMEAKITAGVGAAVVGLGLLIQKSIETADQFNDLSMKTGMSTEALSTLDYALQLSGGNTELLEITMRKFNNTIDATYQLTNDQTSAFNRLGISVKNNDGTLKDNEQLLLEVADKFSLMEDGSTKAALATDLFGKSGTALIPMLNEGKVGLAAMQEEARRLGLEIDSNTARRADEFNDNLTRLEGAVSGVGLRIADQLMPALIGVSSSLVTVSQDAQTTTTVGESLALVLKVIATAVGGVATGAIVAGEALGTFWATAAKIITLNWDEVDDTISTGFSKIKTTALSAGSAFNALWTDSNDLMKMLEELNKAQREQDGMEEQRRKAKALSDEWKNVSKSILQENTLFGLNEFDKKEQELIFKANELRAKFYQIPGALDLINFNLTQKLAQLYTPDENAIRKMQQSFELPEMKNAFTISPAIDVTGMQGNIDLIKSKMGEISSESMIHFAMIEMAGTDAFGMIGDSLMQFSQMSNNKHKELFAVAKAFSIAQAVMNTYEGATKAFAQGGIFGYVTAAGIIAAGLANVARIASTQPGSSGTSGGGSYSRPSYSEATVRNYSSLSTTNSKQYNITFLVNGDVVDPDQWFRKNKAAIQKLFNDGIVTAGNG